jgi:dethiobiotin synthetase
LADADVCLMNSLLTTFRHITRFAPGVRSENIYQFQDPVSPHLAAQRARNASGLNVEEASVHLSTALKQALTSLGGSN